MLFIPAVLMWNDLNETRDLHGTIIGIAQDHVKVGKTGSGNRYNVAIRYQDGSTDTIAVPFDYYLTARVDQPITHSVRVISSGLETFYVFGSSVCISLGLVLGIGPFLWNLYMAWVRRRCDAESA